MAVHMDELIKMPVASDKPGSLRFMFDKVNVHIRGLKSLGVASEQYGSFLIPMIMSKLPDDIRLRVARESRQDVWKIEEILEVVKVEVEAREASESVKVNPQHNQNVGFSHKSSHYTANSLYAGSGKVQCVYCSEDHFSASCPKVSSVSKRKEILLKSGRCFTCLRSTHKSRECSSTKSCRYCH